MAQDTGILRIGGAPLACAGWRVQSFFVLCPKTTSREMLGMWSLRGHFGVLEHLIKSGIAISAWVKARLLLLPLCQEQDAFANTEEPE